MRTYRLRAKVNASILRQALHARTDATPLPVLDFATCVAGIGRAAPEALARGATLAPRALDRFCYLTAKQ
jgi:hypothetical protein